MVEPVPTLRPDLRVEPDPDGAGALLHDPVAGRWHRVGPRALKLLRAWDGGDRRSVLARTAATDAELDALLKRLAADGLVVDHGKQPSPRHRGALHRAMHGYLFVRVPLFDPTPALDRLVPLLRPILRPATLWFVAAMGLVGVLLGSRHAGEIARQLGGLMGLHGALWLGMAFVVSKLVHEMGHAVAARRLGARVPTLGLALMVLWPVLYTDTSDAWRLPARQRLVIDAGGVLAEGVLAVVALWAWLLLPDGGARDAALMLAMVGLVGSLLVNLNPFMRFDGYHLLADAWRMPNLQPRAFAMARWRMREALFGLGEPPPEPMAPLRRRLVVLYAWGTWAYRLVLFVGIALLVYSIAFKALGIALFVVEIAWFVLRPLRDEAREWWARRQRIARSRRLGWGAAAAGAAVALFVPWSGTVVAPAVLVPVVTPIHAPEAGRLLVAPERGSLVQAGATIAVLGSPNVDAAVRERLAQRGVERARLHRASVDRGVGTEWRIASDRLAAADEAVAGARAREAALHLAAPHPGTIVNVARDARAGLWVGRERALAHVLGSGARVHVYVPEAAWVRVRAEREAMFVPRRLDQPRASLGAPTIAGTGRELAHPLLSSRNGGPLALVPEARGERLRGAHVRVVFEAAEAPDRAVVGTVRFPATRESVARRVARRLAAVAIREAGL